MKSKWIIGPPPGPGRYWIASVFEGCVLVDAVEIGPAVIHRNDPNAMLLVKMLGGLAYRLDEQHLAITHHMSLDPPRAP